MLYLRETEAGVFCASSKERRPSWDSLIAGYPSKGPYASETAIFLPTKAAMLLHSLQKARPNHHLIMADFTSLPDVVIAGRQAPLVTSKVRECTQQDPRIWWTLTLLAPCPWKNSPQPSSQNRGPWKILSELRVCNSNYNMRLQA